MVRIELTITQCKSVSIPFTYMPINRIINEIAPAYGMKPYRGRAGAAGLAVAQRGLTDSPLRWHNWEAPLCDPFPCYSVARFKASGYERIIPQSITTLAAVQFALPL